MHRVEPLRSAGLLGAFLHLAAAAALAAFVATAGPTRAETPPPLALRGLDPIELVAGREVAGNPESTVVHGAFRYAFASSDNRRAFEREPDRFAAQFGGACMKMGPLSGRAGGDRFTVFEGRIYLHASESCQNTFRSAPRDFVDRADEPPSGTPESARRAAELLERAVAAVGGAERLSALSSLQIRHRVTQKVRDREVVFTRLAATRFPDLFALHEDFGEEESGWLLAGDAGYLSWEPGRAVDESVRQVMVRERYRQPLAILWAWRAGQAVAHHVGSARVDGVAIEKVAVGVQGATSVLGIDPTTGRVLTLAYRGRLVAGLADLEHSYSDFRTVRGVEVPFGLRTVLNGEPLDNPRIVVEAIEIDQPLPAVALAPSAS